MRLSAHIQVVLLSLCLLISFVKMCLQSKHVCEASWLDWFRKIYVGRKINGTSAVISAVGKRKKKKRPMIPSEDSVLIFSPSVLSLFYLS